MSFFNSIHFLIYTAIWIAAYFAYVRFVPKPRHEGFLLAMSLWWTFSFFEIPASFLLLRVAVLTLVYYLGTARFEKPIRTSLTVALLAGTVLWWIYLRFPYVLAHFGLPSPTASTFLRQRLYYFVGVPFTVCRLISFFVDSRNGKVENSGLVSFLLYISYFPTLMSGPVTNYSRFIRIEVPVINRAFGHSNVVPGIKRIILGIFKRQLLASFFWSISLPFIMVETTQTWRLWLGAYAYYVYLFIDFSGYTDLALGVSKIINVNLPENFNAPFLARNPRDFWQRWHISFLDWLNQYILTPLYRFELRWFPFLPGALLSFFAVMATFIFAGLWHGEGTRFLAYGVLNGLVLWVYRTYDEQARLRFPGLRKRLMSSRLVTAASIFLCFHYVVFALMVFSLDRGVLRLVLARMWNG